MTSLKQSYTINAPVEKVWDALVNPKTIEKWGGGPAKMKGEQGFNFSLWGGDITGKNTKIIPKKELHQDWMSGKWGDFSKVTFRLSEKKGKTVLELIQTGIPENEFDDISEGWKVYYLGEIKKLLE